ncbi:MAG TPA: aminotransferase class I/II-fold pyridoxal phosphate-dependent enzyme [Microbacteriaceae bacterium]|nr:aminotransferase class I/II-fold pyridoxal phosphate-dependent enzyme [Microbacteriaceae bacterium]
MAIPYGRQSIDESDVQAVVEVLHGDWLTTGPKVTSFERAIAATAGTPDAAVVSNGTAALHCAYAALGVGPGDEVVVTPLTFVATAATATLLGASVVFADVEEDTGNLDPRAVAAAITERTKAVAAVDFAGHPAEIDELLDVTRAVGAALLEDAAHSIASTYRGMPVGGLADVTTFSFFPTKNLTSGEGGAVVSPDAGIVERARRYAHHGTVRDRTAMRYPAEGDWYYEVEQLALNYRLPDVLCALGESQLARIHAFKARRSDIFERYVDGLSDVDELRLPTRRAHTDPMWHLFPVRVPAERRRAVFERLRERGVNVQVNYVPVYWHPAYADLGYRRGQCPVAEQYYREEISLPMYADLSAADQDYVIETLRGALE